MTSKTLHFSGPYSFRDGDISLFHSPHAKSEGIYLWVIKDRTTNQNYIHYIGETKSFAKRQSEHITHILGLDYMILDAESAVRGVEKVLWKGMWRDRTLGRIEKTLATYDSLSSKVTDYISIVDVYFTPTNLPSDIRKHVEGSIGRNLRDDHPDHTLFYPDDNHIGTKANKLGETITITSDEPILGLDSEIEI